MFVVIKKKDFSVVKKDVRRLYFGLNTEAYVDLFPVNAVFTGVLVPITPGCKYSLVIDETTRDNPKSEHPIGTIRVLSCYNPEDYELIKLALKNDYGLSEEEYELLM